MPLSYGDYSDSRIREVYQSDIKVMGISIPVGSVSYGSPVYVTYTLESDASISATNLAVDYSTDSGENYSSCTADDTDPLHEGISSLTASPTGTQHIFVWDSASDLTTAFQSSTMQIRIRSYGEAAWSGYLESAIFEIDMLPGPPTLYSPDTNYFDADTTPDLIWLIPADPGSDKIHFGIEISEAIDFSSLEIEENNVDNLDVFMHLIDTSPGTKEGANGQTYYARSLSVTSVTLTTVSFADLINYATDEAFPTTLTNPQILIINRTDRRCYIDPSTITGTGFDIAKSSIGVDDDGEVDLIIFSGAAEDFDTYWVDISGATDDTAYTYSSSPFDTDILGNSIPASISNCRPLILEGNDCPVFIESVSDSGFTLRLSNAKVESTGTIRVCLRATPSDAYISIEEAVASFTETQLDFDQALDDITNGSASWPDYIPGAIILIQELNDRRVIAINTHPDYLDAYKSSIGVDDDGSIDIHAASEPDANLSYWSDVSINGVPDSFEGEQARFRVSSVDALAADYWYWRVRGANMT